MDGIVTKSQFARMMQRNPSQITRWIEEKKLHGAAIDGSGRGARVVVAEARRQLGLALDPAQQLSQTAPLFSELSEADVASAGIKNDYLTTRNRKLQADATRSEIELEEMRGRLVQVDLVRGEFNERLQEIVGFVDGLPDIIGNPLAEQFGLDRVALRIALRRLLAQERVRFIAAVRASLQATSVALVSA
jgi:hypothetical protein